MKIKYHISGNFDKMEILALFADDKNTPNKKVSTSLMHILERIHQNFLTKK